MCIFTGTFLETTNSMLLFILTVCFTCLFAVGMGLLSVYFMRLGAACIAGQAGFLVAILLNNAWLYKYKLVAVSYSVAGLFFAVGFCFGLLPHKFNHASMIGNSIVGAYFLARGLSVYIGYWPNEVTLLGQMKRDADI